MQHVIWNRNAGSAQANVELCERLEQRHDTCIHFPESGDETRRIAKEVSHNGAEAVIAAGGDGTVNDVVQGLADANLESKLGIIPLGTGNDLCRNIGIPLDATGAARLLDHSLERTIDLVRAEMSDHRSHYVNMATGGNTGLYADIVTDEMKQFWGPLVYLRGMVDVLADLDVFRVTVAFDDEAPVQLDVLNVFVANGRVTGGGLLVAPDAQLDDGLLDVIIVKDCGAVEMAGLAAEYVLSDYRNNENIVYRQVSSVDIQSTPPLAFSADGDILTDEPVRFCILPGVLRVITAPDE